MKEWIELVKESAKKLPKLFIVGNKIDIEDKQVNTEKGKSFAVQNQAFFFEVSAKDSTNVDNLFQ